MSVSSHFHFHFFILGIFFFSFFISFSFFFRFFPLRRFPFIISTLDSEFFPFYYHHFSRTVRLQPPLLPPTSPLTPQTAQTATTAATGASIGHHRRHWRLLSLPLSSLSPHTATVVTDFFVAIVVTVASYLRHCLCLSSLSPHQMPPLLLLSPGTVTTALSSQAPHACATVCVYHYLCLFTFGLSDRGINSSTIFIL